VTVWHVDLSLEGVWPMAYDWGGQFGLIEGGYQPKKAGDSQLVVNGNGCKDYELFI